MSFFIHTYNVNGFIYFRSVDLNFFRSLGGKSVAECGMRETAVLLSPVTWHRIVMGVVLRLLSQRKMNRVCFQRKDRIRVL